MKRARSVINDSASACFPGSGSMTVYLSYGLIVGSHVWQRRPHLIGKGFAVSLLAVEGQARALERSVDLARHDESSSKIPCCTKNVTPRE
jgi:hypothetical protein